MPLVQLTTEICNRMNMSKGNLKAAIDANTIAGKKISDRIYLIDDVIVPPAKTETQTPIVPVNPNEPNPLAEAEQKSRIAKAQADEAEQTLRITVAQQGCKKIEEALAKIDELKKQAEDTLTYAGQIKAENIKRMEALVAEKQEVVKINARLQLRETQADDKLADAERLTQELEAKTKRYEDIKAELKELVVYYQQNILPVSRTVKKIAKTIYTWIEPLTGTGYDFTKLYNYLCGQTDVLEQFVADINKPKEPPTAS